MNTCSAVGVNISPQIRILHTKHFFVQLKGKPKKSPWLSKILQYLQLQYICHAFSIQQAAMFVYGSIEDHMFDFLTGFFFTTQEMFLCIKNEFVENKSVSFKFPKIFISKWAPITLLRAFWQSSENLELCRRATRSCDCISTWFF